MSQPPTSSPRTKSWGIVGQLESAESSWRIRGSVSTSTAANGVPSVWRAATVRAEKPQAGASGVPFMKRIDFVAADRLGDLLAQWAGLGVGLLGVGGGHAELLVGWIDGSSPLPGVAVTLAALRASSSPLLGARGE